MHAEGNEKVPPLLLFTAKRRPVERRGRARLACRRAGHPRTRHARGSIILRFAVGVYR